MALEPSCLLEILGSWGTALNGRHIAIDGKTMRGSRDNAVGKGPLHVVRAWVDAQSLSAGQIVCAEKSNEPERSGDSPPDLYERMRANRGHPAPP